MERHVTVRYSIRELPQIESLQIVARPQEDESRTKDLSEKEISFTANKVISPQAILDIKLMLPTQKEPVNLVGRVIDCEKIEKGFIYEIKVQFIDLNDEQRKLLRNFIQSFLKDKGK